MFQVLVLLFIIKHLLLFEICAREVIYVKSLFTIIPEQSSFLFQGFDADQ